MSHNLNIVNGKASMMYVDSVPWHGLGQRLDHPATAEEAIEAANLDYTVVKKPLQAVINGKRRIDVSDYFATVRTDTQEVLGVVGARYSPVQNREAFVFFDSLVGGDKTLRLPHGSLKLRKGRDKVAVVALDEFLKIGPRLKLVRSVPEQIAPDIQAIINHIKTTGEIPAGVQFIPAEVRFSYNTLNGGTDESE